MSELTELHAHFIKMKTFYIIQREELRTRLHETITDQAIELGALRTQAESLVKENAQLRKDLAYWTAEDRACG